MGEQEIRAKCLELACDMAYPECGQDWHDALMIAEQFEVFIAFGTMPDKRGSDA